MAQALEKFEIDFANGPLTALASASWTDVSTYVLSASCRRGRRGDLDRFETGAGQIVLDNADRRFEPGYASGAYYPNLLPLRKFRWTTGENPVANPRAATATTGWTASYTAGAGLALSRITSDSPFGAVANPTAFEVTGTPSAGNRLLLTPNQANSKAVTPGDVVTLAVYVKGVTGVVSIGITARCLDGGGAFLSNTLVTTVSTGLSGWQRIVVSFTVPASAGYVGVRADFNGTNGVLITGRLAGAQIVAGAESQPYVDAPYPVFVGHVIEFPPVWEGDWSTVTVGLVDAFEMLGVADLVGTFSAVPASGTRVGAVLDAIAWAAADRSIATGVSSLQADTFAAGAGENGLSHLFGVHDTELGALFMSKDGKVVFHDRNTRRTGTYVTASATFTDAATPLANFPAARVVPVFDRLRIANDVRITARGGTTQVVTDATSQTAYGPRSFTRDILAQTDAEAADVANGILFQRKTPLIRFRRVELEPWFDDGSATGWAGFLDAVLAREISDRINVQANPPAHPGSSSTVSQDVHIEAIEHDLSRDMLTHRVTFDLSPVDSFGYWIMDTSTLGTGAATTILAF